MLIAQITDIHLGFEPGNPEEPNVARLRAVLAHLSRRPDRPDLVMLSGDLTEYGDQGSYTRLAELLGDYDFPFRLMVGNHDAREAMRAVFPGVPEEDGFIHYVEESHGLRLIVLDTVEPGRHGGAFCEARADWLARVLRSDPQTPVVIAMHHPPMPLGISWLDPSSEAAWIVRLSRAVAAGSQIRAILTGHVHRAITTTWRGIPLTVCPSSAAAVALDLRATNPAHPDNRPLIVDEPPAYAMHHWDGKRLISHFQAVALDTEWPVLARYTQAMQTMARIPDDERND